MKVLSDTELCLLLALLSLWSEAGEKEVGPEADARRCSSSPGAHPCSAASSASTGRKGKPSALGLHSAHVGEMASIQASPLSLVKQHPHASNTLANSSVRLAAPLPVASQTLARLAGCGDCMRQAARCWRQAARVERPVPPGRQLEQTSIQYSTPRLALECAASAAPQSSMPHIIDACTPSAGAATRAASRLHRTQQSLCCKLVPSETRL